MVIDMLHVKFVLVEVATHEKKTIAPKCHGRVSFLSLANPVLLSGIVHVMTDFAIL